MRVELLLILIVLFLLSTQRELKYFLIRETSCVITDNFAGLFTKYDRQFGSHLSSILRGAVHFTLPGFKSQSSWRRLLNSCSAFFFSSVWFFYFLQPWLNFLQGCAYYELFACWIFELNWIKGKKIFMFILFCFGMVLNIYNVYDLNTRVQNGWFFFFGRKECL